MLQCALALDVIEGGGWCHCKLLSSWRSIVIVLRRTEKDGGGCESGLYSRLRRRVKVVLGRGGSASSKRSKNSLADAIADKSEPITKCLHSIRIV